MRLEIFEKNKQIIAIPVEKINSVRWLVDSLILYVEVGPMSHYFGFETEEEGLSRFNAILENMRAA